MKLTFISILIAVSLLISGCTPGTSFDGRVQAIVQPYRFSIAGWEIHTLIQQIKEWLPGGRADTTGGIEVVKEYFEAVNRITALQSEIDAAVARNDKSASVELEKELQNLQQKQSSIAPDVEKTIEGQIEETLTGLGIYNPTTRGKVSFPPVKFKLEELPTSLVISPRDKIEAIRQIVLNSMLTLEDTESIEANVDKLGVSSLVVDIGGIATYPSLVDSNAGLRFTIDTAVHEWLHQYLAFTPLGFRYLLNETGLSRNYDIATMNESLADIAGKEIGAMVYEKYYSERDVETTPAAPKESDFNLKMREIRKAVDVYLARGEITGAENYMEQERLKLVSEGYNIRKLNQAYFAFYGTYADSPGFLNPIGQELKDLRAESASLKYFINIVAGMTGRQDLTNSLN